MLLDYKKHKVEKVSRDFKPVEDSRRDLYVPPKTKRAKTGGGQYEKFLAKYKNLEEYIDKLNSLDLVYYFREVAKENGYRYTIANIKKDAGIMKRLLNEFSQRDVCGMIEFLYTSEQDYLDKTRLTVNVLSSNWINTIYPDYTLWLEDKYVPKSKQTKNKGNISHEWKKNNEETSSVGEW